MKHSIRKIFNNLSMFLVIITIVTGVAVLLIVEQNTSYTKVNNLNNQKKIISSLTNLNEKDIELALIEFNGKSQQLLHETLKLQTLQKYNITGNYLLGNSKEYTSDLKKLNELTTTFSNEALNYYTKKKSKKNIKKDKLYRAYDNINNHINDVIIKNVAYDEAKFNIIEKVSFISIFFMLIMTLWYRQRLNSIYKDILFLYSVDANKKDYDVFSEEADAIALRMKRKNVITDNPAFVDPITGINNNKGLVNAYAEKKGMKDNNFTSVTIFEIDNFSKSNRVFPQEFTQNVLKKIAFTISLHEQSTDVIARTDYNQFTVILSRATKEQSFKDADIIRQTISEIKFKAPEQGEVQITVCGGFIIKPNNKHLDEALRQAREVLIHAKSNGKNRISQIRDLAEEHL